MIMNSIKNKLIGLCLILLSTLVGLVIMELFLQLYYKNDRWVNIRAKANILRDFKFNYKLSGLYEVEEGSVNYYRNIYGLRDSCNDPSNIKVLTVGGSTTDQRYVKLNSTYQSVLEDGLKNFWEPQSCVSNAGVDGHSTFGHLFSFDQWFPLIPNLNPEYIVLYIGINDLNLFENNPNIGFDNNNYSTLRGFLKNSYIIRFIYPVYKIIRYGNKNSSIPYLGHFPKTYKLKDYSVTNLNPNTKKLSKLSAEYFRLRLLKILSKIRKLGALPICVSQPHQYVKTIENKKYGIKDIMAKNYSGIDFDYALNDLNKVMFEVCGPYYIDVHSRKFEDDFFYDGIHTTSKGSEFIGKILVEYFLEKKLF